MYTYHLQHLNFDAAEMVDISRDLAYASVVLRGSKISTSMRDSVTKH